MEGRRNANHVFSHRGRFRSPFGAGSRMGSGPVIDPSLGPVHLCRPPCGASVAGGRDRSRGRDSQPSNKEPTKTQMTKPNRINTRETTSNHEIMRQQSKFEHRNHRISARGRGLIRESESASRVAPQHSPPRPSPAPLGQGAGRHA
eukprot:3824165-Prymnesium_polylepis.1